MKKNDSDKKQKISDDKKAENDLIEERLKNQNMTKEQAQKLLNSTTQQEVKYLQQIKKQKNSKGNSNNRPDW